MRGSDLFVIPAMVIVSCGGTLWGAHHSYLAIQNPAPVEISCADYLRQRPDAAWLRLTRCFPDFDHLGVESSTRTTGGRQDGITTTVAVYVPLRGGRASTETLTQILLVSDDHDMLAVGASFGRTVSDELVAELSTSVEGVVEQGLALSQRRRTELAQLNLRLTKDFVIVERGARPRPIWFALLELGLGLGALFLLVRRVRRWSRAGATQLPTARLMRERAPSDAESAS